jgi:hypothetical protein
MGSSGKTKISTSTYFMPYGVSSGSATITDVMALRDQCTTMGYEIILSNAPGAGNSWEGRFRAFYEDQTYYNYMELCTISNSNTGCSGTVVTGAISAGVYFNINLVPTGTPTATGVTWWFWCAD